MDLTYEEIREYHALYAYVEEHFQEEKANYLATLFTGRYIEIHVFPFSFQEYCQYYDETGDKEKLFDEYSIKGGLIFFAGYVDPAETERIPHG